MEERTYRVDPPDEEAGKAHAVVYLGEGMLQDAQQVAHRAAERFRQLTGESLPPAEGC